MEVTRAVELFRRAKKDAAARRQGTVNWLPIAQACIRGFGGMRERSRQRRIRQLQSAVYRRLERALENKQRRVASAGQTLPAVSQREDVAELDREANDPK